MALAFVSALTIALVAAQSDAESVDVTIRRAPYVISSVSTKSEHAWAKCKYCGSKISYERTYRWNVYQHVWEETTKFDSIPTVCRKCQSLPREQAKLDQKERKLDAKIDIQRSRLRIKSKERELQELRQNAR